MCALYDDFMYKVFYMSTLCNTTVAHHIHFSHLVLHAGHTKIAMSCVNCLHKMREQLLQKPRTATF